MPTGNATPALSVLWRMTRPAFLLLTVVLVLGTATATTCGCGLDFAAGGRRHAAGGAGPRGRQRAQRPARRQKRRRHHQHPGHTPFTGGSRLIQSGLVTERQTDALAKTLLLVLVPAGLLLAVKTAGGVLLLGLAGLLLVWAYSAPPLRLMARGLGELAVAGAWFLVVVGSDYVQRHKSPSSRPARR